jgi:hypothetical protein
LNQNQNQGKDRSVKNLSERLDYLYPDPDDKENLGITHWKGKPIIPVKEWRKIGIPNPYKGVLNPMVFVSDGLQFFPDGLVEMALLSEGSSVDPYDESIFPYHDGDGIPRPDTEERKWSLDSPESKLSAADRKLWETRVEEARAKARKEDPFEIWIEEYKELLEYKGIKLPVYNTPKIV